MNKEELLWLRRYNQYCGKFMYKERCRRGISEQKISRGVCTRTELRLMENGETPWKKMTGDYLLQRLGVPTEYFEVMADARELNGWRDREDICLIIFEQPQKAQQLLEVYQKKYRKKTPFEEQFLKKMQTILLMQAYKKRFESKSVDVEREKSEGENLVESFQSFKEKLDVNVPLNRQEVLFMESNILYKREKLASDEYLRMLKEALSCTMPELPLEKWNMWVFQREEGSLAGNIADKLEKSGEYECAKQIYQALYESFELQMKRTQIPYRGYVVITTGLVNLLGDHKLYRQSMQKDKKIIKALLNDTIEDVDFFLYDICWSLYELEKEEVDKKEEYQNWRRKLFLISYQLASFFYSENSVKFYKEQAVKYLGEKMTL